MEIAEIKSRLERDIKELTDYRGFVLAGAPKFNNLFGRDSLFVSWQLLDYDPGIAKVTLKTLAYLQANKIDAERDAEPGKILHEMWEGDYEEVHRLHIDSVPFPYYGSVDSTPLFLIVAGKYFEKTKDLEFINKIWPKLVAAKNWILTYGDANKDGFVDFDRKNPNGPFNQCWKDGAESPQFGGRPIAAVEVQGYKYEALKCFDQMAEAVGEKEKIGNNYLEKFKEDFYEKFFWPEERFIYLAIDGGGKRYESVASNAGHLLFTDLITADAKKMVVDRLLGADMRTPFGIRTHSMKNKDFKIDSYQLGSVWPFDNWLIAEGLRASGFKKEREMIKDALIKAFSELGCLPELYAVDKEGQIMTTTRANPLQAWSSGGLLNLLL